MQDSYRSQIFLGRQPILNREEQLLAYELLFREGPITDGQEVSIVDPSQATATVIANAFTELSASETLGPYRGFINVDEHFLFSELIEALPQQVVVIELLETVPASTAVLRRCRELRDLGFCLAIDDVIRFDESRRPLLELAEIIKIDILNTEPDHLAPLVEQLRPFGKKLLAEKVESAEQVRLCRQLGFELFQGYFFAKPAIIVGKKLNPSQITLLSLLSLVLQDADTAEIENAFKIEPGLTVSLLRLTNSVSNGLTTRITSLRHAITLLGRRQLQRWLQLLIYTNTKDNGQGDNPLLPLAATRGRLMELLSDYLPATSPDFAEQAFMVGIMSLMPALLGVPMQDILSQIPVTARVKEALIERNGRHGQLLELALLTEENEPEKLAAVLTRQPGINAEVLGDCLEQALFWANNLGRDKMDVR